MFLYFQFSFSVFIYDSGRTKGKQVGGLRKLSKVTWRGSVEFLQQTEYIITEPAKYLLNTNVPGALVSFRELVMNKSQTALCPKASIGEEIESGMAR